MSEYFGKRKDLPFLTRPSPTVGERRGAGTVRPSPFENLPPRDVAEEPARSAAPPADTADQAETGIDLVPATYQAVMLRAAGCPSCVFVPANGKPFARSYGFLQGIDWLRDGSEGFAVMYHGSSVEIRGRGLWPVFLALSDHRAYAVHQFNPDAWQLPRSGPVITHIVPKTTPQLRRSEGDG